MADYKHKLTVQEALNSVLNTDRDALKIDLEGANLSATLDVRLDSANDSVALNFLVLSISVCLISGFYEKLNSNVWKSGKALFIFLNL